MGTGAGGGMVEVDAEGPVEADTEEEPAEAGAVTEGRRGAVTEVRRCFGLVGAVGTAAVTEGRRWVVLGRRGFGGPTAAAGALVEVPDFRALTSACHWRRKAESSDSSAICGYEDSGGVVKLSRVVGCGGTRTSWFVGRGLVVNSENWRGT